MMVAMEPIEAVQLIVGAASLAAIIWRIVTWHNHQEAEIAALRREIESNERDDEARDDALRQEFENRLNAEKELLETKLANHAQEDSRMMTEIKELQRKTDDIWKAVSSIEKQLAALHERNR